MNRTLVLLAGIQATALAVACNGQVDVGQLRSDAGGESESGAFDAFRPSSSGGSGGAGGSSSGTASSSGSAADASAQDVEAFPADAEANSLSGKYTGYIESFQFPDGSDVLVLNLTFVGDGTVSGTVYFGTGSPLAPPTDPSVGYPPGVATAAPASLFEGFAFTVIGGTYSTPRVQLSFLSKELWKQWCGLQTTIYPTYTNNATDGSCGSVLGYGCLPDEGFSQTPSGCTVGVCGSTSSIAVDCGKLALCYVPRAVCTCTATSCTVPLAMGDVSFDMQLTSGTLSGSLKGFGTQLYNVHLTRSP
jgi:hypothetical protein